MVNEFWPISLLNVIFKINSKVLANRLRPHIHSLWTKSNQPSLKTYTSLIVWLVLAASHNSNIETVFVKLDVEKAFDSVSWDFLFELLLAKGFGQWWIEWIKTCLLSGTSSILVNAKPGNYIQYCKGLNKETRSLPTFSFLLLTLLQESSPSLVVMIASKRLAHSHDRMILSDSTMLMTPSYLCREMLGLSIPSSYYSMCLRWWLDLKLTSTNYLLTTWVDVKRWVWEPLPFSNVISVPCHLLILDYQSKRPQLQGKIANLLLRRLRRSFLLRKVMSFRKEVDSFLWTSFYHPCLSILCPFTIFRNEWSMALIIFVGLSVGKAQGIHMEGCAW